MCNLIKKLPLQKSAGADGITAKHLRYAHYCACIYLSVLFNLCVSHGFIPEDCLITDIVPILKCKNKKETNVGNYRPIAVATTISKLFEHFILFHIKLFCQLVITNSGLSVVQALICVSSCSSKLFRLTFNRVALFFSVFLDAFKAFDRVSHELLFKKLLLRDVPPCFIQLLRYWYRQQQMRVRWRSQLFRSFGVSEGVRQRGILSPYLFAVYIDQLTKDLNRVSAGCYIGNTLVNHIIYADDVCCFSPSVAGLQDLMYVIAFLIKMVLFLIVINLSVCSFSLNHFTSRMSL